MTGFWKIHWCVILGLFHFIDLANSHIHTLNLIDYFLIILFFSLTSKYTAKHSRGNFCGFAICESFPAYICNSILFCLIYKHSHKRFQWMGIIHKHESFCLKVLSYKVYVTRFAKTLYLHTIAKNSFHCQWTDPSIN